MKRLLLRLLCMIMAFMTFFSLTDVSALAASSRPDQTMIEYTKEKTKEHRVDNFPNRIAEVTVSNDSNQLFTTNFYLTPNTHMNQRSFSSLNKQYHLKEIKTRALTTEEIQNLEPEWVETIFDVGNFSLSLYEFNQNPSFWNGFWVVADGAAIVFPGVPALSGVKRMVESSSTLHSALKVGVMQYGTLKNRTIPAGWERHHIIEKRFAPYIGWDYLTTENNMLAIPMPYDYHKVVTNILMQKIPYGSTAYYLTLTDAAIFKAHKEAYYQMYYETGDEYWEFLAKFVETGLWRY